MTHTDAIGMKQCSFCQQTGVKWSICTIKRFDFCVCEVGFVCIIGDICLLIEISNYDIIIMCIFIFAENRRELYKNIKSKRRKT